MRADLLLYKAQNDEAQAGTTRPLPDRTVLLQCSACLVKATGAIRGHRLIGCTARAVIGNPSDTEHARRRWEQLERVAAATGDPDDRQDAYRALDVYRLLQSDQRVIHVGCGGVFTAFDIRPNATEPGGHHSTGSRSFVTDTTTIPDCSEGGGRGSRS